MGGVHLRRVTCAVDTGIAVNPDTIMAQLQGGLIFGLTAALWGEVTIEKGRVQQSNFHNYRMLRIDEMPTIEVHVIKSGEHPGGIGETGATAGPPALAQCDLRGNRRAFAASADRPRRYCQSRRRSRYAPHRHCRCRCRRVIAVGAVAWYHLARPAGVCWRLTVALA